MKRETERADAHLQIGASSETVSVEAQTLGSANGLQISGGRYIFAGPAADAAQQYAFGFTHSLNQNLILDLRAAFTRINKLSLPLSYGSIADTKLAFGPNMNFNALSSFLTPIQFGPFNDIGDGAYVPLQDIDNTFQYAATVSYTKGNHNIKIGGSFIRRQARNVQSAFAAGRYGFGLARDSSPDHKTQQDNQLASSLTDAFSLARRNYTSNAGLKNAPFVSVYNPNCQSSLAVAIETRVHGPGKTATQNPDCATMPGANTTCAQGLPVPAA